jgi:hypothetical protein
MEKIERTRDYNNVVSLSEEIIKREMRISLNQLFTLKGMELK